MSKMTYFIFGYFSKKLGTTLDGHGQIITWNFIEIAQEINGGESQYCPNIMYRKL
jgi:hypothetical protein